MDNVTSTLANLWSEVGTAITEMMKQPLVALALTIPVGGGIISISKRLFRRK